MNKILLIGNLTDDVDLMTTSTGISVAKFRIAVRRDYKTENGEYPTDFISVIVWRTLAENCKKYLSKGKKCAVCGSLQTRSYENKDGVRVNVVEVVADNVEFLSPVQSSENDGELVPVENEDDLPF